ncbi:MAG: phosphatidate cytidylyltransferase [Deltaproteobacteria bacterium]|nr:phosphatidate cytidylyltransferase [Deltaproteobacteria bacterium]
MTLTNLQKRILVSAIYFPALLLSANDARVFSLLMTLALGACWHEYLSFRAKPTNQDEWIQHGLKILLGVLPTLFIGIGLGFELAIGTIALVLQIHIIRSLAAKKTFHTIISSLSFSLVGFVYLTGLFSLLSLIQMRSSGREAIWFLFFVVALTDTAAYFWGKQFGRTPFFQNISPSKTKEGFWAGMAGAMIVGIIFKLVFSHFDFMTPNFFWCLVLAAALGFASVFGDLFESMLKRTYGVKDSGTLLPGHGGVLDRLDGVLFAAVPLFFFMALRGGFR